MNKELLSLLVGDLNDFNRDLEMFLGARVLRAETKRKMLKLEEKINTRVYRGLPFPKQLLKVGDVIEEWYGSTHWTIDVSTAIGFTMDYVNDEYIEDLEEQLGETVEVIKVVLCMNNIIGVESYKLLELLNEENFKNEKEISVFDSNFKIEKIDVKDDIYYVEVSEINSRRNKNVAI